MNKSNWRRRGLIHVNSLYFHHERMSGWELKAKTPRQGSKQTPRRNTGLLSLVSYLTKDHVLRSGVSPPWTLPSRINR